MLATIGDRHPGVAADRQQVAAEQAHARGRDVAHPRVETAPVSEFQHRLAVQLDPLRAALDEAMIHLAMHKLPPAIVGRPLNMNYANSFFSVTTS